MVIFKQAMAKYFKAPSTWIILLVSLFITGFVAGYLPFTTDLKANRYGYSVLVSTGVVTTMVSIFSSIFAGFKGTTMFRDEIESGTFLVLLSKPISRTKIIFEKWLALQGIMLIFASTNIILFEVVILFTDSFKDIPYISAFNVQSISGNLFVVGGYMFTVLFAMGLIFSSIAMILSTKLSGATTIGISIGLGVVIPITGMIGAFTHKTDLKNADNYRADQYRYAFDSFIGDQENLGNQATQDIKDIYSRISKFMDALSDPVKGLYKIGVKTGDEDKFDTYYKLDLNYQMTSLGAIATENIVTNNYKNSLSHMGVMSELAPILKIVRDDSFDYSKWDTKEHAESDVFNKVVDEVATLVKFGDEIENYLLDNNIIVLEGLGSDYIKWKRVNEEDGSDALASLGHWMKYSPLWFLLDEKSLNGVQKDTWQDPLDKPTQDFVAAVEAKLPTAMKHFQLDQDTRDTYRYLMNIVQNDRSLLIYAKVSDYVSKRTLLWVYLGIAMGLVPISLLIMRKKDFR